MVWMWTFRKDLTVGNDRRSRGNGTPTLRRQDGKSNQGKMYELEKSNSMLQGAIAKANEWISFLEEERKGLRKNLNNVGECSSDGRLGTFFRNRGTGIRIRMEYGSTTDEEGGKEEKNLNRRRGLGKVGILMKKRRKATEAIWGRTSIDEWDRINYSDEISRRKS